MVALNFKAQNIGIDLGTANTIVYLEDEGIVTREPSVVAKNIVTEEIIAVGKSAFEMIGDIFCAEIVEHQKISWHYAQ